MNNNYSIETELQEYLGDRYDDFIDLAEYFAYREMCQIKENKINVQVTEFVQWLDTVSPRDFGEPEEGIFV